ncbi:MAG: BrnT family toxin [Rhizobiaceae bacterium]
MNDDLYFEWDGEKAETNLAKHGVSFLTASEIFANEIVNEIDDREDYGEMRFMALGRVGLDIYRVAYTWRDENLIRIISAWKAAKHEREIYYRKIFT